MPSVIEGVYFPGLNLPLERRVNESSPPGTFIAKVQAVAERITGALITYSLANDKGWFEINSTTGVITVARTLDREETSSSFQFEVVASKSDETKGTKIIFCTVLDLNDNYPQFENLPYQVNISENTDVGEVVFQVSASDKDSSDHHYNTVYFKIAGGDKEGIFEIDGLNGKITLKKPLDFEGSSSYYYLNITATDEHGAPTGNQNWTVVTIGVLDADDLPPKFSQYLYEALIEVDTPQGREIVKVHAEDQDSVKAPVSYAIYPESDPDKLFTINNITGSIAVNRNLTRDSYPIIVTAKSTNHPVAFALVMINVGAMPNQTFETVVMENEANTTVFDLKPLEQYFNVSNPVFQIHQGGEGDKFFINGTSKKLKVGPQALDREQQDQYTLVVELLKNGKNKGFALIIIKVLDANDNTPKFQNKASVSVGEDTSPGTVVFTAVARDPDAGQNGIVMYAIISGNERGIFALNNQTGALSLVKPLDYESVVQYTLNISAYDTGQPQRKAFSNVTIHVIDANDNSPALQARIIRASVSEGAGLGSFVARCQASDADAARNARITYHLVQGADYKFSIDNATGVIRTSETFDIDADPQEYTLVVKAQDDGVHPRSDVGFVVVNVFPPEPYTAGVYKDTTYYSLVTTVEARDNNSDSVISYKIISGNEAGLFHVEPYTGHVRVASSLADKDGSKFTLEIIASDGGEESSINVTVNVFVLRDKDSILIKTGVIPEEISKHRQQFLRMLETITGGKAFIKYLQQENGKNATVMTFHVVKNEQVMPATEVIRSLSDNKELLDSTYKKFNIQWFQLPDGPSSPEARKGTENELSAVVGAMICLGVIIGVGAIILIIILIMRKRKGQSPFKKKRQSRVTFNDKPFFIDPVQSAVTSDHVDSAQEAQEVIIHIPAEEDNSSLEENDSISHGVSSFINFGYAAAQMAAMNDRDSDELDDIDHEVFFPPPPVGPPPPPPDSDDDDDDDDGNKNNSPVVFRRSDYENGKDSPELQPADYDGDVEGTVLSSSPSDSTTGSTDQLVTGYPKGSLPNSSFLTRFSLTEDTTEL